MLPGPAGEAGSGDPPCVVHLVRAVNGVGWLREFAAAMRAHPPGIEHQLVLAMKGFASAAEAGPYLEEVADLAPEVLFFADRGFDLGVYFAAATRLRRHRYCFVNSHARPLVDGWLAKLEAALNRPGVGQVGATGSWASRFSWLMHSAGIPSPYRGVVPPRRAVREVFITNERKRLSFEPTHMTTERPPRVSALQLRLHSVPRLPFELFDFGPFPAHHLRPNVFMITHAALSELRLFVVRTKMDTGVIEAGRESITRQLERMGLTSLVVDRAGAVYVPEEWHRSRTLWQGDQEGLLAADNRTLSYTDGDFALRELLSTLAWGPSADPRPPREELLDAARLWVS
jgi:hypothetical protein